jgi:hypothetical protein
MTRRTITHFTMFALIAWPVDVVPGQKDLNLKVIKAYGIFGTAVDAETGKPVLIDTVRLCVVDRDPDDGHVTLRG